jgi:ubiquinone/menaquinone biosynthesis C-methylase UbiE
LFSSSSDRGIAAISFAGFASFYAVGRMRVEMSPAARADRSLSSVEVRGLEARHYDLFMNVVTAGTYPFFIRRAIREMGIQPDDAILDLGSGSGRNACLMARYLDGRGRIVGLDIGEEMLAQARRRCRRLPNVTFEKRSIDGLLPYAEEFDRVFISFVLHGFLQQGRLQIIANARRALRPGGRFFILDYNEFEPAQASSLVRLAFGLECPLAAGFVRREWGQILTGQGFVPLPARLYYWNYVRLLEAEKRPDGPA